MNDETDDVEDEEQRKGLIPPVFGAPTAESLSAPLQSPVAPAQHGAGLEAPASGSTPLQHSAGAEAPASGSSPLQHSAQPQGPAGGQHTGGFESPGHSPDQALQHSSGPHSAGEQVASQHTPGSSLQSDATQAQHITGPESPGGNAAAQHSGLQGPKPSRIRRLLQRAAQRPRGAALIAAGVVTVTIATVVIVAAAQKDPPTREIAAANPTVVETTDAPGAAPVTTAAPRPTVPATTAAPTTTVEPTTTTEAPTTTTIVSGAGTYNATTSGFTLSSPEVGFSQSIPGSTGVMTLTGDCDGIGPCTAGFADGTIPNATETGDGFSDTFEAVVLTPNGADGYTSLLTFPVLDCGGDITLNITMTVGGGAASGSMDYNFPGSGADCPSVTWGFTFTATKTG